MKLDKKLHLGIAYILASILSYFFGRAKAIGAVESLLIGKELHDKYLKRTFFSMPDLYAGNAGLILGIITYSLFKALRDKYEQI